MKIQLTYRSYLRGSQLWLTIITVSLLALWIVALVDQLFAFTAFQNGMRRHSLPSWLGQAVAWVIPISEATAILLLVSTQTLRYGLWLSALLLSVFTVYIGLGIMTPWVVFECFCSKFITSLSWWGHFWLNLIFLVLSLMGLLLYRKSQRSGSVEDTAAKGGSA